MTNNNNFYKTIIIGAGPAGLIAGRNLMNDDFLILEKQKQIGKLIQCGEGISETALTKQGIAPDNSWISSEIYQAKRIMPNGKYFGKKHKKLIGYIIDRTIFEKNLAEPIINKIKLDSEVENLKFENGFWKIFTKNKEIFKSKYIIGADGASSVVRRIVFPENKNKIEFFPAIEYLVKLEKEINVSKTKIFFDNEKYNGGYAWIFPKSKNTANIGVGAKKISIESFNNFLNSYVKNRYGSYSLLINKSGIIPVANKDILLLKNNVFLVGDAGGLADLLFKGGITRAMVSARIAAECINKNKIDKYYLKLKSANFLGKDLINGAKAFNSLTNKTLNELGEILDGKEANYLKTFSGIIKLLLKPNLRKDCIKLFKFFNAWWKNKKYLW